MVFSIVISSSIWMRWVLCNKRFVRDCPFNCIPFILFFFLVPQHRSKNNVWNNWLGTKIHRYGRTSPHRCQSKRTIRAVQSVSFFENSIIWHSFAWRKWQKISKLPTNIYKKFGPHSKIPFCTILISWKTVTWTNCWCVPFTYLHASAICPFNSRTLWLCIVCSRRHKVTFIVRCLAMMAIVVISLTFTIAFMYWPRKNLRYVGVLRPSKMCHCHRCQLICDANRHRERYPKIIASTCKSCRATKHCNRQDQHRTHRTHWTQVPFR